MLWGSVLTSSPCLIKDLLATGFKVETVTYVRSKTRDPVTILEAINEEAFLSTIHGHGAKAPPFLSLPPPYIQIIRYSDSCLLGLCLVGEKRLIHMRQFYIKPYSTNFEYIESPVKRRCCMGWRYWGRFCKGIRNELYLTAWLGFRSRVQSRYVICFQKWI